MSALKKLSNEIPLTIVSTREVYREPGGADFAVTEVRTVVKETGEPAQFNVVSVKNGAIGAVCVVVDAEGRLLLGKHWRVATNEFAWEFPRGMGELGEADTQTASRELQEETGIASNDAVTVTPRALQRIHADSGLLSGSIAVVEMRLSVSADEFDVTAHHTDWELSGGKVWISPEQLATMISRGEITDGITLAAFAVWQAQRTQRGE